MATRVSRAKVIAAVLSAIGFSRCAGAQISGSWISPTGGSWSDTSKWSTAPNYPDNGGTASFGGDAAGVRGVAVDVPVTLSTVNLTGPTRFNLTGTKPLTFTGPSVIDVSGTFATRANTATTLFGASVFAPLIAPAGLTKTGDGVLILSGSNSFSSPVRVAGGTLAASGLSNLPSSTNLILDGGTFRATLSSISSSWSMNGSVTLGAGGGTFTTTSATSGITINGPISGPGGLNVTADLPFPLFTTHSVGLGTVNSFTGPTVVHDGQLTLFSNASIASSSDVHVFGRLFIQYATATPLVDKLGDNAPLELRGAYLGLSGPSVNTSYSEQFGPVTLSGGHTEIVSNFATGTFRCVTLTRSGRATVDFFDTGTLSPSRFGILGAPPTLAGSGGAGTPQVGIVPWAQFLDDNSQSFPPTNESIPVTVDNGSVRPLAASEFVTALPSGASHANVRLSAPATAIAPTSINSLSVASTSLSGSATITVESGAVHLSGAAGTTTEISAPLDFGTAEGVFFTAPGAAQGKISSPVSGSGGITIDGNLVLTGTSTYTGQTVVNGALTVSSDVPASGAGPLGSDRTPVLLVSDVGGEGALILDAAAGAVNFARPLIAQSPNKMPLKISATGAASISGAVQADGSLALVGAGSAAPLTVSGKISGVGMLYKPRNVTLSGDNDFTDGVDVGTLSIAVGSDTALGTGTILTGGGGTLSADGRARSLANPIAFTESALLRTGGSNPLTLTGDVSFDGLSDTIAVTSTAAPTRLSGDAVGGVALTKSGVGRLDVKHLRMPAFVNVSAGTLGIIPNGTAAAASNIGSLAIAAGAALDLTDNALVYDYPAGGASPSAAIRSLLAGGYHGGDWTGSGITNSTAAANASGPHRTAIGYAEAAAIGRTTFFGRSADATSLLLRYTLAGDADLSGNVDLTDFTFLAANFNKSGDAGWLDGDFNYDGNVNLTDFTFLASNFNQTLPTATPAGAAVPEPVAPVLLLAACAAIWSRRRRAAQPIASA